MTPSEAHESAWQRDPGHDEMTLAVLRAARVRWQTVSVHRWYADQPEDLHLVWSGAEVLFGGGKARRWFADCALQYRPQGASSGTFQGAPHWRVFEIKPRIYSAGALVRQMRAQEANAEEVMEANRMHTSRPSFEFAAVVRAGDPLVQITADLLGAPILTWDGESLAAVGPADR